MLCFSQIQTHVAVLNLTSLNLSVFTCEMEGTTPDPQWCCEKQWDEIWEKCVSGSLQDLEPPLCFSAIMTSLSLIGVWNKILIFIEIWLEGLLSREHQKIILKFITPISVNVWRAQWAVLILKAGDASAEAALMPLNLTGLCSHRHVPLLTNVSVIDEILWFYY